MNLCRWNFHKWGDWFNADVATNPKSWSWIHYCKRCDLGEFFIMVRTKTPDHRVIADFKRTKGYLKEDIHEFVQLVHEKSNKGGR